MADDALESVLRLVSEGHLTAEEAEPILDALAQRQPRSERANAADTSNSGAPGQSARALRIEVHEHGRPVVNLRVPLALGRAAINHVPGISDAMSDRIREAIAAGITGPILQVEDVAEGGVRISIE
jgi:hypothetical protein